MKELIRHLIHENMFEMMEKSLLDCHCVGLHSIMLIDTPEKRVRMFVSTCESEMWQNHHLNISRHPMSIGFHPHHCNLTLHVVKGEIKNWIVKPDPKGEVEMSKFLYQSKITKGETSFKYLGQEKLLTVTDNIIKAGESVFMHADEIHTVAVPRGQVAAWMVYEGNEYPGYEPYIWSNSDLTALKTDHLYRKAKPSEIVELLAEANLL